MSGLNFKTKPYAHQLKALEQAYNKEYYRAMSVVRCKCTDECGNECPNRKSHRLCDGMICKLKTCINRFDRNKQTETDILK